MQRGNAELGVLIALAATVWGYAWKAGLLTGMLIVTGCASRTGWEFRVGVAPVTAVDNNSKLEQDKVSGRVSR